MPAFRDFWDDMHKPSFWREVLCCTAQTAEEPELTSNIKTILLALCGCVPAVLFAAAVDISGEVLAIFNNAAAAADSGVSPDRCVSLVPAVKRAAARYAGSVNASAVVSLHISGSAHTCRIYEHLDTVRACVRACVRGLGEGIPSIGACCSYPAC